MTWASRATAAASGSAESTWAPMRMRSSVRRTYDIDGVRPPLRPSPRPWLRTLRGSDHGAAPAVPIDDWGGRGGSAQFGTPEGASGQSASRRHSTGAAGLAYGEDDGSRPDAIMFTGAGTPPLACGTEPDSRGDHASRRHPDHSRQPTGVDADVYHRHLHGRSPRQRHGDVGQGSKRASTPSRLVPKCLAVLSRQRGDGDRGDPAPNRATATAHQHVRSGRRAVRPARRCRPPVLATSGCQPGGV